jgi:hypothetical protein
MCEANQAPYEGIEGVCCAQDVTEAIAVLLNSQQARSE